MTDDRDANINIDVFCYVDCGGPSILAGERRRRVCLDHIRRPTAGPDPVGMVCPRQGSIKAS
jgi:hypothetical protein